MNSQNADLVSILIPVYNREKLVIESIQSAQNQTYKNIEIIVCDNCSTDNTFSVITELAKADSKIKVFQNEHNLGPVGNWKRCVELANSEFSKILFSDDLISANFIEECLSAFKDDCAFVMSRIQVFNEEGNCYTPNRYYSRKRYSQKQYLQSALLDNHFEFTISPGSSLFRTKDLLDAIDMNIENDMSLDFNRFGAGTDLLIFLNIARNYPFIATTSNTVAYFRAHDGSFTIANNLMIYYEYVKWRFIKRYYPELEKKFVAFLHFRAQRHNLKSDFLNLEDYPVNHFHLLEIKFNRLKNKILRKLQKS
jgi:glycosyltransferase involved in cell wall biosynthesis